MLIEQGNEEDRNGRQFQVITMVRSEPRFLLQEIMADHAVLYIICLIWPSNMKHVEKSEGVIRKEKEGGAIPALAPRASMGPSITSLPGFTCFMVCLLTPFAVLR